MPNRGVTLPVPIRKVLIAASIAITLLVVLVGSGCGAPDRPTDPSYEVGFNNNAVMQGVAPLSEVTARLKQVGADVDRVQISWATLEPEPGRFDFGPIDRIYEADLTAGVEPLFIFAFAPPWAATDGPCDALVPTCHLPPTPDHYDDAARAAAALAERYPGARGIEIWNEPNTPYFWQPAADPDAYTELLKQVHAAVKEVAPQMPVAGASTSASPAGRAGYIEDQDFIAAIYERGAAESMDALSVHVYDEPGVPSTGPALAALDQIEATRERFGADEPIWITEAGSSTSGGVAVSVAEQRALLPELVDELGSRPEVEMVLLHTLLRKPTAPGDPETGFGIAEPGGSPLPVFCDLARDWGGLGC